MLVTQLPSDLRWKNNSMLEVKSAMLQNQYCLNIYIYMQSHRSNIYLFHIINTLVLILITNKLWNPVLFSILNTPELQRLSCSILLHRIVPKILQKFLEVESKNKSIIKMYNIPFSIRSIRNMLQCVIWNLERSNDKSVHSFPTT